MWKLFKKKKDITKFGKEEHITLESSNHIIKDALRRGKPFCAVRFGAVELSCWNNYEKIEYGFRRHYKDSVTYSIKNNAGVFPTDLTTLDKYSKLCLGKLKSIDILGISGLHMEEYFADKYTNKPKIVNNYALEPLMGDWVELLKDKKVLVISPFAKQISKQYKKRELLFENTDKVLPEFKLTVLEAVQTIGYEVDERFESWFEALQFMKNKIDKISFDVMLVGAGSYGMLLAMYAKEKGKIGIQTGGATQTLFGLMGKRWEERDHVAKHVNEHWSRPDKIPFHKEGIENGAYW